MSDTAEKQIPIWEDGKPCNLAAASADAREWLLFLHNVPKIAAWLKRKEDAFERLENTIQAIEHFLQPDLVEAVKELLKADD